MAKWIEYTDDERRALITRVSSAKNIDQAAAEKDWWVTAVLYALFHTSPASYMLFKGGTSLSKGWDIISRFSEDVDIALDRRYFLEIRNLPCASCASNTQIHHLREQCQDYLFGEFRDELSAVFASMGLPDIHVLTENEYISQGSAEPLSVAHDKDPSVLYVSYPALFASSHTYARPMVKIEISCLSMSEPFEPRPISSLVQQVCSPLFGDAVDSDFCQTIHTVSPSRTLLEKCFLLCEEYQKSTPRTSRMSRHLYDIEKLSHTDYLPRVLSDAGLYMDIIRHRKRFYHPGYVDYSLELPQNITFLPPQQLLDAFRSDYADMCSSFIYESHPLSFDDLLSGIADIQSLFRQIPTNETL